MDSLFQKLREILENAETQIRELGANAFRTGDDDAIRQAQAVVIELKQMRAQLNGQTAHAPTPGEPSPTSAVMDKKSHRTPIERKRLQQSQYPKFEVRNNTLVRIGWSKKQKQQYEHKVPRDAFDRTVKALAQLAETGGGPFTAETIIKHTSNSNGAVPSYQAYVVIGLLRDRGYIEQVGRDGYVISHINSSAITSDQKQIDDLGRQAWNDCVGVK